MQVQTYLFFEGRCEEALEFYKTHAGAHSISIVRFKQSPDPTMCAPASLEKVMHADFKIGDTTFFASDGRCSGNPKFDGFSLSITTADVAEAEKLFASVGEGGKVMMPLGETFFATRFGMVTDKFGVIWMVLSGNKKV